MPHGLQRARVIKTLGDMEWVAPLAMKVSVLPMVFWARALHGSLSCVFANRHVPKLRTQAMKHLGIQLAGSNAMLWHVVAIICEASNSRPGLLPAQDSTLGLQADFPEES